MFSRKKHLLFLCAMLTVFLLFTFVGCGDEPPKQNFTGITFDSQTVTYDGNLHELKINGTLPEGATVSYSGNSGTDAGTYVAKATLACEGYETKELQATLTIKKADFSGITLTDDSVFYDGMPHSILVKGTLPTGTIVTYENNNQIALGTYAVKATLTNPNYNTATLSATLNILTAGFTAARLENNTVTYDGNEHRLEVSGALPKGTTVTYSGNGGTNVGTYEVSATLTCEGYETKVLHATLTIQKANFTGITLADDSVVFDKTPHSLAVNGTLPTGTEVTYENNAQMAVGTYTVKATLTNSNYNTLQLTATLTIQKATFTGISFEDKTVVYNGEAQQLTISGDLPEGATVAYHNNSGTNAGVYEATATLTCDGYETTVLQATLTIQKATFTGISLKNRNAFYNGNPHSLEVKGTLPADTQVTYENNEQTEVGSYTIKATLTNPNYDTLTLTAILNIRNLVEAKKIVDALLSRPDAWSFLPTSLSEQNMAYTAMPTSDFTQDFVAVNQIGKKFIGKQLHTVYSVLKNSQNVIETVDMFYAAGEAIAAAYQTFLNTNPDNVDSFTGTVEIGGVSCTLSILLNGDQSSLTIGNNTVNLQLYADSAKNVNTGKIQITSGAVLKYVATDTSLRYAIDLEISGAKVAQSIEFVRNADAVTGYVYEYYSFNKATIKTTILLHSNEDTTIVTGDKRETDDMKIEAYEEVYRSATGEFLGGEVAETVKNIKYDTLWFNLYDVSGFRNVKIDTKQNEMNADTIYVNDQSTVFQPKKVGGLSLQAFSRRYDIEMKEVWYVVSSVDEKGKTVYSVEKTLIPMLFVQKNFVATFPSDVVEQNAYLSGVALPDLSKVTEPFTLHKAAYLKLKELVTYDELKAFIQA